MTARQLLEMLNRIPEDKKNNRLIFCEYHVIPYKTEVYDIEMPLAFFNKTNEIAFELVHIRTEEDEEE